MKKYFKFILTKKRMNIIDMLTYKKADLSPLKNIVK